MEKNFRLTSSEYAKIRDLSVEALRSRRRRELERDNYIVVDGKYWWRSDRPITVKKKGNSRPVPGPRSPSHAPRKRNRGALARGEKPDYPNWKMEERNQVLALAKIRGNLGDEVYDEVTPEVIDMAKKRVAEKKLKKASNEVEKLRLNGVSEPMPTGLDRTPPEYGRELNRRNLDMERGKIYERENRLYEEKSETKFIKKNYIDLFGYQHTKTIIDFDDNSRSTSRPPPYYVGEWVDPNSVEIDERNFTPEDCEPEFKNKIEEHTWRLKNKK